MRIDASIDIVVNADLVPVGFKVISGPQREAELFCSRLPEVATHTAVVLTCDDNSLVFLFPALASNHRVEIVFTDVKTMTSFRMRETKNHEHNYQSSQFSENGQRRGRPGRAQIPFVSGGKL